MKPDKISSYIGFAMKSGKLVSGEFSVEKAVKEGKARIAVIAEDASDNTKKKFKNMCDYYGVHFAVLKSKEELGRIIGKEYRACVAINDRGLADALMKLI